MRNIYLALCLIGAIFPLSELVPWLITYRFDMGQFFWHLTDNPVSRGFFYDIVITALVVVVLALDGRRRGVRGVWWAIGGTFLIGVSFGLPLYLFLAESARKRAEESAV